MRENVALELDGLAVAMLPPSPRNSSGHQEVEISWDGLDLESGCIAVYLTAGPDTERFADTPWARIGPRQQVWLHREVHQAGHYCYRLVAIATDARGPFADTCADVHKLPGEPGSSVSTGVLAGVGALAAAAVVLLAVRRRALSSR